MMRIPRAIPHPAYVWSRRYSRICRATPEFSSNRAGSRLPLVFDLRKLGDGWTGHRAPLDAPLWLGRAVPN
eukprot:6942726-Prymnesium_polylepis.2